MVPARYAHALFALLLSGTMSLIVSGVSTWRAMGLGPTYPEVWMQAWLASWAVAFPSVFFLAPLVRRLVARLTARAD